MYEGPVWFLWARAPVRLHKKKKPECAGYRQIPVPTRSFQASSTRALRRVIFTVCFGNVSAGCKERERVAARRVRLDTGEMMIAGSELEGGIFKHKRFWNFKK